MKKPQVSVRLPRASVRSGSPEIARLTLNPVLYHLSFKVVDWSGRERDRLRPAELVAAARARFPDLPLSWAVEGAIALVLTGGPAALESFEPEAYDGLPEQVRRFQILSPARKIRLGQRWLRELRQVRGAR
jgi:hypothetical protein